MKPFSLLLLALALAASPAAAAQTQAPKKPAAKHAKAKKKPAPKVDYAGEIVNFNEWKAVGDFIDEMVSKHDFDRLALQTLVGQIRYVDSAVQLVKPAPPGKPKNWQAYSALFIEPLRIDAGLKFWNENADSLARAEAEFGVPAEIIVGIIGVETVYGRNTGRFRVLDTLTTLAFAYPETPNRAARMAFFRGELANALLLARRYKLDPLSLLGSFAGAVGLPQFMPGSIMAYGLDYDGDGTIDLRNSAVDAIGSVAHFLVQHGWDRALTGPPAYPAVVSPGRAWERFIGTGLAASTPQAELAAAGAVSALPVPPGMLFGLVDLQNGAEPTEYWLANSNFFAITQYNRSYFYAMSVVDLGRAIRVSRAANPLAPAQTL